MRLRFASLNPSSELPCCPSAVAGRHRTFFTRAVGKNQPRPDPDEEALTLLSRTYFSPIKGQGHVL